VRVELDIRSKQPGDQPIAMTIEDIKRTIGDYVRCAQNAILAGFDCVEIHGANGYLPDQFLNSNINIRTDQYGGSIENRNRFVTEVVDAIGSAIGYDRLGLRLAPYGFYNECHGEKRVEQWSALCSAMSPKRLAYVHVRLSETLRFADPGY
jgi:2,4-dienoyl-CoA reductase-like NADH-dependent reductase (Old Yellow Enzyme family)